MNPRATLVLSLLLNAVLLATAVVLVRTRVLTPPPAPSRPHMREVTLAPRTGPARPTPAVALPAPDAALSPAPAPLPFHWRQLESADYREYIANLRAVGCPERTIADIILADVEKMYEQLRDAAGRPEKFWATGRHPADVSRERQRRERALEEEQAALIRELLGIEWQRELAGEFEVHAIVEFVFGFLPETKQQRLVTVLYRSGKLAEALEQETENLLLPEDKPHFHQLYREAEAEVGKFLSPAEREEAELRMGAFAVSAESRELAVFGPSVGEFRELVRAQMAAENPMKAAFHLDDDLTEEQKEQRAAQKEERLRAAFGEPRYAEFTRAQDERFKEVFRVAEEHKLPRETAVRVFDLRVAAEAQAAQIRADAALTPEQRAAQLDALRTATAQGSVTALGAKAGAAYVKGAEKWLQKLGAP